MASEAKVFQTKERAPLLLCIEAFRPEEFSMNQKINIGKPLAKASAV